MSGMETQARVKVPVLIIGSGPAGLAAGLLLNAYGVETLTVSKYNWMANTPRAHHFNPRVMEMLRGLKLEAAVRDRGFPKALVEHIIFCATLGGEEIGRVRTYHQSGNPGVLSQSPCQAVDISQHHLEPILMDALLTRGGKALLNTECLHVHETEDAVLARLRNRLTQQEMEVEAQYLIAADGANSAIAEQLGLSFEGQASWGHSMNCWVKADLSKYCAHRNAHLVWTNRVDGEFWIGSGMFRCVEPWDEWIVGFMYDPKKGEPDRSPETVRRRIHEIIGDDSVDIEVLNVSTWESHALYANTYGTKRILCAGDAVHRHVPANGLGANSSMLDAYNLCWKLKLVLSGVASPDLLSTYEAERQPVGKADVARAMKSVREMAELPTALGYRPGATPAERETHWSVFSAPGSAGERVRDDLGAALWLCRYQFAAFGFEMGYRYARGALLPHEDGALPNDDPDLTYVPQTGVGFCLPHATLTHQDRADISTIDLVAGGAFHLLTGIGGEVWERVCGEIAAKTGLRIKVDVIGPGRAHQDGYGEWNRVREIEDTGCILVRPDTHIAWRCFRYSEEAAQTLRAGIVEMLGPRPRVVGERAVPVKA